jgi:hypothetical protein
VEEFNSKSIRFARKMYATSYLLLKRSNAFVSFQRTEINFFMCTYALKRFFYKTLFNFFTYLHISAITYFFNFILSLEDQCLEIWGSYEKDFFKPYII